MADSIKESDLGVRQDRPLEDLYLGFMSLQRLGLSPDVLVKDLADVLKANKKHVSYRRLDFDGQIWAIRYAREKGVSPRQAVGAVIQLQESLFNVRVERKSKPGFGGYVSSHTFTLGETSKDMLFARFTFSNLKVADVVREIQETLEASAKESTDYTAGFRAVHVVGKRTIEDAGDQARVKYLMAQAMVH